MTQTIEIPTDFECKRCEAGLNLLENIIGVWRKRYEGRNGKKMN